jgi:hypothetical protein
MATSDFLKQSTYKPGDLIGLGNEENFILAHIVSYKLDGDTYIVVLSDTMVRVHINSIIGKFLSDSEKLHNLEGHMTRVLLDLQKCIQENQVLRQRIKILQSNIANKNIKDSLELEWHDTFGSHRHTMK